MMTTASHDIGTRIHVMGNSSSGKSTLGQRLAERLDADFVELDALNWEPNWVGLNDTDPEELKRRMAEATRGDRWVAAGSYAAYSEEVFWDRLQTVVWLDLPMPLLLYRMLRRSWRRWRTHELLWGTNYERFWPQLMVWRKDDSLVWWIVTQERRKRRDMYARITNPRWSHIRFIRLGSARAVDAWLEGIAAQSGRRESLAER